VADGEILVEVPEPPTDVTGDKAGVTVSKVFGDLVGHEESNTLTFAYLRPTVDVLDPPFGEPRDTIHIRGVNFGPQPEVLIGKVRFGNSPVRPSQFSSWSDTEIVVEAPEDYGMGLGGARVIATLLEFIITGDLDVFVLDAISPRLKTLRFEEDSPAWERWFEIFLALGVPGVEVAPDGSTEVAVTVATSSGEAAFTVSGLFTYLVPYFHDLLDIAAGSPGALPPELMPSVGKLRVGSVSLGEGETATVNVVLESAPHGLAGYELEVTIQDGSIATIDQVDLPDVGITESSTLPQASVSIRVVDLERKIEAGARETVLATVHLRGLKEGSSAITLQVVTMDTDDGAAANPAAVISGELEVKSRTFALVEGKPAQDLDGDGLFEDLNGNGRLDFADVLLLYRNLASPAILEHAELVDFNGNGRPDSADVVALFEKVVQQDT